MKGYYWKAEDEDAAVRARREQFEQWAESQGLGLEWDTLAYSKFYRNKVTRVAWRAWEAALLREPQPTERASDRFVATRRPTGLAFKCRTCGRSSDVIPLHLTCPFCMSNANAAWPYGAAPDA